MDADVGGEAWWAGAAEGRLIPVPRDSRSAPHLREGAAASQTFRAETRFLTGNFVRLRLPHFSNGSFFVGGSLVVGVLRVQSLHARTILSVALICRSIKIYHPESHSDA